jgi:hypothetical protein
MNRITLGILALGVALTTAASSPAAAQRSLRCLHDMSEQPQQRDRRMDAIALAEAIYRAERAGVVPRPRGRGEMYKPLAELRDLPPTPNGFRLQFHTDGMSYAFVLKDLFDGCQFAIHSDQDGYVYEGSPRRDVRVIPVDSQ